jgi:membrane peptidoglycan carboxypeptidase
MSLNTTYYALTREVGAAKVLATAAAAGITDPTVDPNLSETRQVALGDLRISPLDHASGFATIAAKGVHVPTYFVDRVEQGGNTVYTHQAPQKERAFSADVAADTTFALQQVYNAGRRIADGRPGAGKTGTAQLGKTDENSDAWMVGFTPQLSAAVWVGHSAADEALRNSATGGRVYGNGLPRDFWAEFMSRALAGEKVLDFPPPKYIGSQDAGNVSAPAPAPIADSAPTVAPTARPTPSRQLFPEPTTPPEPTQAPEPSPSGAPLFPSSSPTPTQGAQEATPAP